MNSREIDQLIAKIGGPEGLRNLFIKLKTDADGLFSTFEMFDKTEFNFAKALKNAKGDVTVISQMAKNRLGVIVVEIGQKFLPIWVSVLEKVNNVLSFVWKHFDTIWATIRNLGLAIMAAKAYMLIFNAVSSANPVGAIVTAVVLLVGLMTVLIKRTEGWGDAWKGIKLIVGATINQIGLDFKMMWDTATFGLESLWLQFKAFGQLVTGLFSNIGKALQLALDMDFSGAKAALTSPVKIAAGEEMVRLKSERQTNVKAYLNAFSENEKAFNSGAELMGKLRWKSKQEVETEEQGDGPFAADGSGTGGNGSPALGGSGSGAINKITGHAKQVKSIQINIDSFVKGGINTENTTLQNMDANQLEQYMTDMFLRVIRNVETSY